MKECPKCHYVDPPYWRNPPHYPELDYVRPMDLKDFSPEIFEALRPGLPYEPGGEDPNVYRMTETGKWVYRIWLPIWKTFGPGGWTQFRRTKMFDSAGRLRRENYAKLLKVQGSMAAYRKTGIKLDAFNVVIQQKGASKE